MSASGSAPSSEPYSASAEAAETGSSLASYILRSFDQALNARPSGVERVTQRMAAEVERICQMSDRIQASGQVNGWQQSLSQHRVNKCLHYYRLGSNRGRVELHSALSAIVYRYIAPPSSQFGFEGRYALLEDFMQTFYIEVLNAFRREHGLAADYSPRSRLELAEYMAFSEQYAKRRIPLRSGSQQLIVLRAQAFARRLPPETSVDLAMAVDTPRGEESDISAHSAALQQVREQMVADATDPADGVIRDRIVQTLIAYLESQNQPDCVDYLVLKLEDCSASEIDQILSLSPRERDYLQQRFKYHIEKFAQIHHWELVHQWLGAEVDKRLGLTPEEWSRFLSELTPAQQELVRLKQEQSASSALTDQAIGEALNWTPKKVKRTWGEVLSLAWKHRNE
ncbi:MAG: hypothetical protein ICV77_02535 [Cyanobacteria bacterium Co-bin8]|nr:hypothetical protein [Cyanobacteria bacterium Co-bin8]